MTAGCSRSSSNGNKHTNKTTWHPNNYSHSPLQRHLARFVPMQQGRKQGRKTGEETELLMQCFTRCVCLCCFNQTLLFPPEPRKHIIFWKHVYTPLRNQTGKSRVLRQWLSPNISLIKPSLLHTERRGKRKQRGGPERSLACPLLKFFSVFL